MTGNRGRLPESNWSGAELEGCWRAVKNPERSYNQLLTGNSPQTSFPFDDAAAAAAEAAAAAAAAELKAVCRNIFVVIFVFISSCERHEGRTTARYVRRRDETRRDAARRVEARRPRAQSYGEVLACTLETRWRLQDRVRPQSTGTRSAPPSDTFPRRRRS